MNIFNKLFENISSGRIEFIRKGTVAQRKTGSWI